MRGGEWKRRRVLRLAWAAAWPGLAGCGMAAAPRPTAAEAYAAYDLPARLPRDRSRVRVKVSLSRQRAYVLEGERLLLAMPVGVGAPESPTPRGDFRILEKMPRRRSKTLGFAVRGDEAHRSRKVNVRPGWTFVGGPQPYWCGFAPELGFHSGWLRHHPSTDGSLRMHENLGPKFYALVDLGTPVEIRYAQPEEDRRHGRIPLPPDAGPLADHPAEWFLGERYFTHHREPEFVTD